MARTSKSLFHEFTDNATADVAMSLLRSPNALQYLALMAVHLGDGRIVDGATLAAEISEDLADLEGLVPDDSEQDEAGLDAAGQLVRRWTKKGWVHRTLNAEGSGERYQLTAGADQAVMQVRQLRRHTSIATESTLSMIMERLRSIAVEANPDPAVRRKAVVEQIAALQTQLKAIDAGTAPRATPEQLKERVNALMHLIDRIPSDVTRYGEQMKANTAGLLHQGLSDDAGEFAELLNAVFDGVDVINESPEGKAFQAFSTLIGTPSQRSRLEDDIQEILAHVPGLPREQAESLSGFIDTMWQRVQDVMVVRGSAFRRISNFVRGGDAAHYRSMRTRVAEAQAAASAAFAVTHGGRDTRFFVPMAPVASTSVGKLRLDEGTATIPDDVVDTGDEFDIDAAALAGAESIDWESLRQAVNAALEATSGFASLADVMDLLPTARTGDVFAIWSLANRYGEVDDAGRQTVTVHTARGLRDVELPYMLFGERLPDPAAPAAARRTLSSRLDLEGSLFDV